MAVLETPARTSVASVSHRAFDGLSVAAATPVTAILAAEAGVTDLPGGLQVFCLEREGAAREKWTSDDIPRVLERFRDGAGAAAARVLPYAAVKDMPADALAPAYALRRTLDDKRFATRLFAQLGLPRIDGLVARVTPAALARAAAQFGVPFVARAPFGSTGNSTYLVDDPAQPMPHSTTPWLLERFVPGYSINATAVAVEHETVTLPPSVQIIGQPACHATRLGYCGSDFAALVHVPEQVIDNISSQTRLIGEAIRTMGYRGVFGVDFVIDDRHAAFPIEINPRYQNSTALLNFALGPDNAPAALHLNGYGSPSLNGPELSQLMVYTSVALTGRAVRPGTYRGGVHRDDTCDPRQLRPGGFLAVGTVERDGMHVAAGAALARLVFPGRILEADLRTLTPDAQEAIRWLRSS